MESNKVHQEDLKRNQEGGPNGNERKPAACDHPSHHCLLEQPGGGAAVKLEFIRSVRSVNQVIEPLIMTTTRREKSVEDLKEVGLDCNRLEIEAECCTVSSCGKLQVGSHP